MSQIKQPKGPAGGKRKEPAATSPATRAFGARLDRAGGSETSAHSFQRLASPLDVVQPMRRGDARKLTTWIATPENKEYALRELRTGEDRGTSAKELNYSALKSYLVEAGANTRVQDVLDAAPIVGKAIGRVVEAARPSPIDAAKLRDDAIAGSSDVMITKHGVDVYLDNDQLKHQPKAHPIGTRKKGGGTKFKTSNASATWHRANTLDHMADWADGLEDMNEGEKRYHGQATAVEEVHYEGYCLLAEGKKYVFFHCYPSYDSELRIT